jgi:hypothetical protein
MLVPCLCAYWLCFSAASIVSAVLSLLGVSVPDGFLWPHLLFHSLPLFFFFSATLNSENEKVPGSSWAVYSSTPCVASPTPPSSPGIWLDPGQFHRGLRIELVPAWFFFPVETT